MNPIHINNSFAQAVVNLHELAEEMEALQIKDEDLSNLYLRTVYDQKDEQLHLKVEKGGIFHWIKRLFYKSDYILEPGSQTAFFLMKLHNDMAGHSGKEIANTVKLLDANEDPKKLRDCAQKLNYILANIQRKKEETLERKGESINQISKLFQDIAVPNWTLDEIKSINLVIVQSTEKAEAQSKIAVAAFKELEDNLFSKSDKSLGKNELQLLAKIKSSIEQLSQLDDIVSQNIAKIESIIEESPGEKAKSDIQNEVAIAKSKQKKLKNYVEHIGSWMEKFEASGTAKIKQLAIEASKLLEEAQKETIQIEAAIAQASEGSLKSNEFLSQVYTSDYLVSQKAKRINERVAELQKLWEFCKNYLSDIHYSEAMEMIKEAQKCEKSVEKLCTETRHAPDLCHFLKF